MPEYRFRRESKAAFMCECGASLCDERVSLSGSDYESLAGVGPVVAEGHEPVHSRRLAKCPVCGREDLRDPRRRR